MSVRPRRSRFLRRRADVIAWQQTIDRLAMQLCPLDEWEAYTNRINQLEWLVQHSPELASSLRAFPVWKKYRREAQQVAALYQAIPLLQRLPLRWASLLGKFFFQ